ncbi:MAG TPA: MASE1 domain-containing protein [Bellilinea sp.]|nr:MASE1 domain-containing protein [Bellilinea sp.]
MKSHPVLKYILKLLALGVIYRLGVVIGLSMAYVQSNTSPVWPPTGIAIAALLLFGWQLWPAITLGVLLGSLLTGAPLTLAIGMAIGNTLEALAVVFLLRRFGSFHPNLERIRDVISLVMAALAGTVISATFGALSLLSIDNSLTSAFWQIWATWWIGDFLGALVVGPFFLVWGSSLPEKFTRKRQLEAIIVFAVLALVTWYVFFTPQISGIAHRALLYVVFPFTIWAALRTGQRGAAAAIVIVSGIAIWGTTLGYGPFADTPTNDSLILLQTFMAVVALTSLILAAATTERHSASEAVNQKVRDLATLNLSSETLLTTLGQADFYGKICQLVRKQFGVDVAWIEVADGNSDQFTPVAISGAAVEQLPELAAVWKDGVQSGSTTNPPLQVSGNGSFASYASFPLLFSEQPLAHLQLLSRQADFFDKDRQLLLQSFANLGAIAIQNSLLLDRVQKGNEQLHALSQRLMKAQEEERLNLSRELHDELGQLLIAAIFQLGLLERNSTSSDAVQGHVQDLRATVNKIQQELHSLAINLRPASLDHVGLVSAIEQYINEFRKQYGLKVEFETAGMQNRRLPSAVETAIFRIVQESLTNVILHAQATQVDVVINRKGGALIAIIEDDGVGFFPSAATDGDHLGLFGMRERVEMLGGSLTIESEPGKGTTVRAEVPCDD